MYLRSLLSNLRTKEPQLLREGRASPYVPVRDPVTPGKIHNIESTLEALTIQACGCLDRNLHLNQQPGGSGTAVQEVWASPGNPVLAHSTEDLRRVISLPLGFLRNMHLLDLLKTTP